MAEVTDIIFTDDIQFSGGDFDVDKSDQQHVDHIIRAKPGQFYQFPELGVGIDDFRQGTINKPFLRQQIKDNLEKDNYRVNEIIIEGDLDTLVTQITAERLK